MPLEVRGQRFFKSSEVAQLAGVHNANAAAPGRSLWPRISAKKISVGHVFGLKLVARDCAVGAAEVSGFPGQVALAEGELYLVY
jgi:hypothetical protein